MGGEDEEEQEDQGTREMREERLKAKGRENGQAGIARPRRQQDVGRGACLDDNVRV